MNKEIEEIINIARTHCDRDDVKCDEITCGECMATALYEAGYRKESSKNENKKEKTNIKEICDTLQNLKISNGVLDGKLEYLHDIYLTINYFGGSENPEEKRRQK